MNNSKLIAKNLIGRPYWQAPIMAARIDRRSSIVHNLATVKVIESACGIEISSQTKKLRDLMLAAEIIKNHTNNLYFNNLPDFLGLKSASELSKMHPELFNNAVALREYANRILIAIGGRAMHPITSVAGGFKSYPEFLEGDEIISTAEKTLRLFAGLNLPKSAPIGDFAALHENNCYAFYDGEIWTSAGELITKDNFIKFADQEFYCSSGSEKFSHSSDKCSKNKILTGPLARYNLNQSHFDEPTRKILTELKVEKSLPNSAQSVLASAVELYYFVTQSTKILGDFVKDGVTKEHILPPRKFSSGVSAVESADGIVIHSCELDLDGIIEKYEILTPLSSRPV